MIRRPPRSTQSRSSAASDVYKRQMQYEAKIEDPEIFTQPWTIKMMLYKKVGNDAELQQFKCVEFVEELIYGQWRAK